MLLHVLTAEDFALKVFTLGNKTNPYKVDPVSVSCLLPAPSCRYWDVATDEWSTEGCNLTYSDNTTARCECSHLTNFGVILDVNGQLVELVSRAKIL